MWIAIGAMSAFIAVAAGAFGAHGLRETLSQEMLAIWETGARYQMYHALGLVFAGLLQQLRPTRAAGIGAACLAAGTIIFSGSLYALALSGIKLLGAITPIGGVALLVGWLVFCYDGVRRARQSRNAN